MQTWPTRHRSLNGIRVSALLADLDLRFVHFMWNRCQFLVSLLHSSLSTDVRIRGPYVTSAGQPAPQTKLATASPHSSQQTGSFFSGVDGLPPRAASARARIGSPSDSRYNDCGLSCTFALWLLCFRTICRSLSMLLCNVEQLFDRSPACAYTFGALCSPGRCPATDSRQTACPHVCLQQEQKVDHHSTR